MQKFIKGIPFILLMVLVPFFFYNEPNLSQAIIASAIAGLCGFRYYLMEREQPNYALLFSEDIITLKREIAELRDRQADMAYNKKVKFNKDDDFVW